MSYEKLPDFDWEPDPPKLREPKERIQYPPGEGPEDPPLVQNPVTGWHYPAPQEDEEPYRPDEGVM